MAGSTSDEQSVFDVPTNAKGANAMSTTRQSSESFSSPPDTDENIAESQQDTAQAAAAGSATAQNQNSKQKRIACVICRKRKLKCDGARPQCSTCARLKHDCGYDETRKKSGPKRGYVKHLEQRLKQIENQLKSDGTQPRAPSFSPGANLHANAFDPAAGLLGTGRSQSTHNIDPESSNEFPWEMIGLGLEEPLPPQDIIDDLHRIYFDKLHVTMPMIHKYRYLAAMNLAPGMRPPVTLRYALWAYAASASEKYQNFQEMFYRRARKYAETDEMKGFGEQLFTVGHVQAWIIIAYYEFKMLYFPRAWMSVGRAVRLAQMHSLHRLDGGSLEVKECLGAPKDWVDREERRRTFWAAYCFDRWSSIGTGWPMNIDERDIHTNLPVPDDNFDKGREMEGLTLTAILKGGDPGKLSSYSSVILMASIIGKTLTHLHRTDGRNDAADFESADFWQRHHYLDRILTSTTTCLPEHLRLGGTITDPNIIFLHMNVHSTAICLHQAAILKAEQNNLAPEVIAKSTQRCYMAATEIANIWRTTCHLDISLLSPYVAFCLFVAARVFVHEYRKSPEDEETRRSLHFLLNAMEAHRKRNDITESFLMQLLVDLDEMGFESIVLKRHSAFVSKRDPMGVYAEGSRCAPVLKKFSAKQPSFRDVQAQAEAQRLAAALYGQNSTSDLGLDSPQLNIPMRPGTASHHLGMENQRPLPGSQLHAASLGPDFDMSMQFSQHQGLSVNGGAGGFATQQGFGIPSQASSSNGQSPGQHAGMANEGETEQHSNFFGGDFDINMLNGTFDIGQESGMMPDLQPQTWATSMNTTSYPDGRQSTPAAAWASFI